MTQLRRVAASVLLLSHTGHNLDLITDSLSEETVLLHCGPFTERLVGFHVPLLAASETCDEVVSAFDLGEGDTAGVDGW